MAAPTTATSTTRPSSVSPTSKPTPNAPINRVEPLRYPLKNIGPYDDYLQIDILDYVPPGLGQQSAGSFAFRTTEQALSGSIQKPRGTIILPMPQQISDSTAANWAENQLNALTGSLVKGGANVIGSGNPLGSLFGEAGSFFNKVSEASQTGEGQQATIAGMSGLAAGALLGQAAPDINGLISRATGAVINQNTELLFNGVSIRPAFNFAFDLVPRSEKEADIIKKIIRTFKVEMSASRGSAASEGGGFFVKSPNVFQLKYMSGGKPHPYLHLFKPCALTNMAVNYTGSGSYTTYSDATPVHMQIQLTFQELSIIYAEDYADTNGNFKLTGTGY